ncbi:MAG: hypothetical protein GC179_29030 [Anaerolineaceae bacterium]|nr:hypothetical protein [Anaerolineaceae bacterium]
MSTWSFSSSRLFRKCQRQWYFKTHVAAARAKDPYRREAFLLSKLQTIYAWRGSIVDQVILMRYVPTLKRGQQILRSDLLKYAKEIFDRQLKYALANRLREEGMKITEAGDSFAAFFSVEYCEEITQKEIDIAWQDIELALDNLLSMKDLYARLLEATHLIPQRSLSFTIDGVNAQGTPDLIAFFADYPPLIIDWKVHTFASNDYRLQLALYALALTSCKPHKDFPKDPLCYQLTELQLTEIQLLTNQQRHYQLTDTDVYAASNYISRSALDMNLAVDPADGEISVFDLPTASNPDECQRCSFRSMCWK